ncbi:uncharacterized protein B0I36DRAFT_331450 [Microdochium trichocladiopsis]|uniref:F-box domain-containing protein n=1 Tax=Microdochium trichocladiopsis TaxID=1682393 RepID=A0A9P8XZD1_9PEZI|nr:uncharacterized protein B0I36DRAFT_331450 [Microdochium trichocladiopsis]KAH7024448.1 hypothetical protein B0I36DRAFT_331450 [Microdochium trichocladiopsis]
MAHKTRTATNETDPRQCRLPRRILDTLELLELILLQLDMRTLLTSAQRVSKKWHASIQGSPALQRRLFFMPDNNTRLRAHNDDDYETLPIHNPLLTELFPAWFSNGDKTIPPVSTCGRQPFARSEHFPAVMTAGASWRRMLVQQRPAISHIGEWRKASSWQGDVSGMSELYACHSPPAPPGGQCERESREEEDDDTGGASMIQLVRQHPKSTASSSSIRAREIDGWLRMGPLYDIVMRHVANKAQRIVLSWTDRSSSAFCGISDVDMPPNQAAVAAAAAAAEGVAADHWQERQRVKDEFHNQRVQLAARAGLVLAITNYYGRCGTGSYRTEIREFIEKFVHPDCPRDFWEPPHPEFELVRKWEGSVEDWEDDDL